jgi:4-hydroxy-tetrahydrodipicolinate reductase
MNPIRLGIFGAAGRLGQLIVARAVDDARFALVSAVVRANSTHIGAAVNGDSSVCYGTALRGDETVIVDVSGATGADVLVAQMRTTQAALICASTGHSLAQRHDIQALAQTRAVLISANLSVGVAVLAEVLREVTQRLPGWDVEIVETHHRHKRDAPSGSALLLADAIDSGRGAQRLITGRNGSQLRANDELGIHAVRGGDVIGDHTIHYFGDGERLELTHRATSRALFANGALTAAAWIVGQPIGLKTMRDVISVTAG